MSIELLLQQYPNVKGTLTCNDDEATVTLEPIERRGNVAGWTGVFGKGIDIWWSGSVQDWAKKLNDGGGL